MGGQAGVIGQERPAEQATVAPLLGELRYGVNVYRVLDKALEVVA